MLKEFQKFLQRGNVLDLAVAVVIGGAFGGIVSSFVKDLLSPILGLLIGKVDLRYLKVNLSDEAVLTYGNFLQAVIEFVKKRKLPLQQSPLHPPLANNC
jgi:large conductance mechanosensitive channel